MTDDRVQAALAEVERRFAAAQATKRGGDYRAIMLAVCEEQDVCYRDVRSAFLDTFRQGAG